MVFVLCSNFLKNSVPLDCKLTFNKDNKFLEIVIKQISIIARNMYYCILPNVKSIDFRNAIEKIYKITCEEKNLSDIQRASFFLNQLGRDDLTLNNKHLIKEIKNKIYLLKKI